MKSRAWFARDFLAFCEAEWHTILERFRLSTGKPERMTGLCSEKQSPRNGGAIDVY
jgi:hypothetical protein